VACGTSWHAALAGKYLIEEHCRIPVDVEIASEFRYRDPLVSGKTLVIPISQSGETADTLAALREAKSKYAHIVSICNVIDSSIPRESDGVIYTHAGLEIGVKVRSNMEEIISRGGKAIAFCSEGDLETGRRAECSLLIPWAGEALSSVLFTVALQLLAYNFAILKGKDVDQPRNLAKSVTVE
jgi:glucosamine 6-phosphate synthetase-like amidotransferase/phosphosugar isomerase protein